MRNAFPEAKLPTTIGLRVPFTTYVPGWKVAVGKVAVLEFADVSATEADSITMTSGFLRDGGKYTAAGAACADRYCSPWN